MSLLTRFISSFNEMKKNNFDKIYVAVDIHNTILVPCWHNAETFNYFPLAKKTLQLMSERDDVCLILWTSSWDDTANATYKTHFQKEKINFTWLNENPECQNTDLACFNKKFYFSVGIDDRCGFNANIDWLPIFLYFKYKKIKDKIYHFIPKR
jgi:hypothetical protein